MATIIRDTHKVITKLEGKGFSREQAEGITDALGKLDLSHLATKKDISRVLRKIGKAQVNMVMWLFAALMGQIGLIIAIMEVLE